MACARNRIIQSVKGILLGDRLAFSHDTIIVFSFHFPARCCRNSLELLELLVFIEFRSLLNWERRKCFVYKLSTTHNRSFLKVEAERVRKRHHVMYWFSICMRHFYLTRHLTFHNQDEEVVARMAGGTNISLLSKLFSFDHAKTSLLQISFAKKGVRFAFPRDK